MERKLRRTKKRKNRGVIFFPFKKRGKRKRGTRTGSRGFFFLFLFFLLSSFFFLLSSFSYLPLSLMLVVATTAAEDLFWASTRALDAGAKEEEGEALRNEVRTTRGGEEVVVVEEETAASATTAATARARAHRPPLPLPPLPFSPRAEKGLFEPCCWARRRLSIGGRGGEEVREAQIERKRKEVEEEKKSVSKNKWEAAKEKMSLASLARTLRTTLLF